MRHEGKLVRMSAQRYESEDLLQGYLAEHHDLLAGSEINQDNPRRWLFVAREMAIPGEEDGTGRWSLDHLFLDQDGILTLVEVKRSTDTRIRREVVAQMLEYAANAQVYWKLEDIISAVKRDDSSVTKLGEFLGSEDEESFWLKVKNNLETAKFRLVFVADEIPRELRRMVEFLNEQMDGIEVLAVEIKQYVAPEGKHVAFVPRLIGQTVKVQEKRETSQGKRVYLDWNVESALADFEAKQGLQMRKAIEEILAWAKPRGLEGSLGKGQSAAFTVKGWINEGLCSYFTVSASNYIIINFEAMKAKIPFESRKAIAEKLSLIFEPIDMNRLSHWQSRKLKPLEEPQNLELFLSAFEELINEVKPAK